MRCLSILRSADFMRSIGRASRAGRGGSSREQIAIARVERGDRRDYTTIVCENKMSAYSRYAYAYSWSSSIDYELSLLSAVRF